MKIYFFSGYDNHQNQRSKCIQARKWTESISSSIKRRYLSKFGISGSNVAGKSHDRRQMVTHLDEFKEPIQLNDEIEEIVEGMLLFIN